MKNHKKKSENSEYFAIKRAEEAIEKVIHEEAQKKEKSFISWRAPEFEHRPKNESWYWMSFIAGIILMAVAVWQKNFLFAVFVVLAWITIIFSVNRKPTMWNFRIDKEGVQISLPSGDKASAKTYLYSGIRGFDIHPTPGDEYKELILKQRSKFSTFVKINIFARDEEKIKSFLEEFLPHEEYDPPLADSLAKLIGF